MEKTVKKSDNIEIQKQKFHQHKGPISIKNVDTSKIVVSNKVYFGIKGFKCFIGYKDDKRNQILMHIFQRMSAYRKDFDETKYISFLIKDDEL